MSIDTKKKELLGNFYRDGMIDTQETLEAIDHDFPSHGNGHADPSRPLRRGAQRGLLNLNTSHDTTRIRLRQHRGVVGAVRPDRYPRAKKLLVLCDGGGSNSATKYLFKEDLQKLATRLGLEIRVAHYPPYCSKYNPIEHRLLPHVTRACHGVVFQSPETARHYMEKTEPPRA